MELRYPAGIYPEQERAMEKQFAASEVRRLSNRIPRDNDGIADAQEALRAFADLLEVWEKTVPVAYAEFADNGCVRMWSRGYEERLPGTRMVPLYIHPAPSDAERLAEALHSIGERLSSVLCDPFGEVVVRGSDDDRQIIAQALKDLGELAAHPAQAQPPAQSEYAPTYPDQANDPFWNVPGMVDTRPKVQPPAASVTDAMVERASRALCQSGKFETGQGTCALICMGKLGAARQGGCPCEVRVHERLARLVIEAALSSERVR